MRKLSFLFMLLNMSVFMAQQIDQPVQELNQAEREQRKSMLTAKPIEAKPEPFEVGRLSWIMNTSVGRINFSIYKCLNYI